MKIWMLTLVAAASAAVADWTPPVEVAMGVEKCVAYQARIDGDYLTVRATHFGEWHTYAMDNELRAQRKLAGKMSLGVDGPTTITVGGGARAVGGWLQSEPLDLSKPEIRWYTFGYEEPALFATQIERTGPEPVELRIRGQACTATQCKNIDVTLTVPPAAGAQEPNLDQLIPVLTD